MKIKLFILLLLVSTFANAKLFWFESTALKAKKEKKVHLVEGSTEQNDTKREICRVIAVLEKGGEQVVHVGKWVDGHCRCGYNEIDKGAEHPSWTRDTYNWLTTSSYAFTESIDLLAANNETDYLWVSYKKIADSISIDDSEKIIYLDKSGENIEYLPFNAAFDLVDKTVYACRSRNKTLSWNGFEDRGIHTGTFHQLSDGTGRCCYEYGDRGCVAPDAYVKDFEILLKKKQEEKAAVTRT